MFVSPTVCMHLCFCLVSAPIEVTVLETSVPFVSVEPREWRSGGFMCLLGICMWEAGNGGWGAGCTGPDGDSPSCQGLETLAQPWIWIPSVSSSPLSSPALHYCPRSPPSASGSRPSLSWVVVSAAPALALVPATGAAGGGQEQSWAGASVGLPGVDLAGLGL